MVFLSCFTLTLLSLLGMYACMHSLVVLCRLPSRGQDLRFRLKRMLSIHLQGLASGSYNFQVRAIDMAGNVGPPTAPYAFPVDARLPLPGTAPASWFTGWHLYSVIAGAAVLAITLVGTAAACACMAARRRRMRREAATVGTGRGVVMDPDLAAALQRSVAEQQAGGNAAEEARLRAAITASMEVPAPAARLAHVMQDEQSNESWQPSLQHGVAAG